MNNVVIHKIVKFIFTENQLKAHWKELGNDLDYASLTYDQLINLASKMLKDASHSEIVRHVVGGNWRTEDEASGKLLAEDDSEKDVHIEVVDTSAKGNKSETLIIDRLVGVTCTDCNFHFYLRDLNMNVTKLKCPSCNGIVAEKK